MLFRILRGSRDVVGGELGVRDTALAHCVLDPFVFMSRGLQGTFAHPTGMHGVE